MTHGPGSSLWSKKVGKLPWDKERGPNDINMYLDWLTKKKTACVNDPEVMRRVCPREYRQLYDYFLGMNYSEKPDCDNVRNVLNECMARNMLKDANPLDCEPEVLTTKLLNATIDSQRFN